MSLRRHNAITTEIEVLAVAPDLHRHGVGGALVTAAEASLRKAGTRLLEVKTLGPSHPDEGYRKTRAFYEAMGFLPLDEVDIWAPGNPALILVKPLQ
jgi:predicted N-acetyltransferase YhbS